MSAYELITQRRSIRRFKQDEIPLSALTRMVNAARLAPSAANLQPLEFIIINEPEQAEQVFSTLQWARYISPAGNPPEDERPAAYIVTLTNADKKSAYSVQDYAAAIENIILTALEEEIGSCWLESIDRSALTKILALPENITINAVVALGYPNEEPVMEEIDPDGSIKYWKDQMDVLHVPKRKLESVLHYNKYAQACPVISTSRDWVIITETPLQEEAYLIQGFLENNGVPCIIEDLKFRELPVSFSSMSQVRLMVPQDKLAEGQAMLARRKETELQEDETVKE